MGMKLSTAEKAIHAVDVPPQEPFFLASLLQEAAQAGGIFDNTGPGQLTVPG